MTSSNGNIFRVTGPLCGEFTGPGEFPAQRPVTRSFDVFFHLRLNKRLSKQPWGWWFETAGWSLWRHRNGNHKLRIDKQIVRSSHWYISIILNSLNLATGLDSVFHDDVIKWKHFPRHWPFVRGIHRSPVNSPHKGQWREALMLSLICVWIKSYVNTREAGDLRRHRAHYDITVIENLAETNTRDFKNKFSCGLIKQDPRDLVQVYLRMARSGSGLPSWSACVVHIDVFCGRNVPVHWSWEPLLWSLFVSQSKPMLRFLMKYMGFIHPASYFNGGLAKPP